MDLSDLLADENAHVQAKEAEALTILAAHAGPAREMLDGAKREFGDVLKTRDLGVFISPTAGEMYKKGRREATRFLFDAYAMTVFPQVRDPEAFIVLLDAIAERVLAKLTVIDRQEAELCRLEWVRQAWERAKPKPAKPTPIRSAWRRLRASLSGAMPPDGSSIVEPAHESGKSTGRAEIVDDFLLRCNQEPDLSERVIRKHLWLAVGHSKARQFQYWQAGSDHATEEDDRNFRRILAMRPDAFVALLKRKNLISTKS